MSSGHMEPLFLVLTAFAAKGTASLTQQPMVGGESAGTIGEPL